MPKVKKAHLKNNKKKQVKNQNAGDDAMEAATGVPPANEGGNALKKRQAYEKKQMMHEIVDLKKQRKKQPKKTNKEDKKDLTKEIKQLIKDLRAKHEGELKAAGLAADAVAADGDSGDDADLSDV
ncbi:unnamed protein product [Polarella glacialis]|uniref:Uncharacterized protein n=1 Tax=Polarella glacialis TaxID=89957 RepID=A0A813EBT2_POLGL|nr:unnamed protein product [Polarella glacialis]CAE8645828.1 unnamed protein product [Polarella glacialis]|eukprot:CAMPEP_0115093998 /NCGR_PEP_ID=MMETSP0227-20121206/28008_1 /TAXON_ID=89957 /ORGANISM="Polarella glacialis, Strain CCMP 1383" /LENGTH=124 /DNA_ID=CAMNT_0002486741 /DNA_START=61 /DNA_END=435 /DNA_ORIENTATION=-